MRLLNFRSTDFKTTVCAYVHGCHMMRCARFMAGNKTEFLPASSHFHYIEMFAAISLRSREKDALQVHRSIEIYSTP